MTKRCSEIIKFTLQNYKNATKKITNDQKYYNSTKRKLIQSREIDKSEYETKNSLSTAIEFTQNLPTTQKEISSYFKYEFNSPLEDEECFPLHDINLTKIDLSTLKISSHQIGFPFSIYNNSCKLPDNNFFVQSCLTSHCFSIDIKSNTVTPPPSLRVTGSMAAVGCIAETVYFICGFHVVCNEAYNTTSKRWSKTAPCPVINNYYSGESY